MLIAFPTHVNQPHDRKTTPIVNASIVAVNVLIFVTGMSDGRWSVGPGSGLISVVTYAFAHHDLWHLVANMWVLWVMGGAANRRMGNGNYLLSYMAAAIGVGVLARMFCNSQLIGASGAVFAVIAFCCMLLPAARARIGYLATFPITILMGLLKRPRHWLYWLVRVGGVEMKVAWGLALVPLMELWGLWRVGWNWSNIAHLAGLALGFAIVLILPAAVSMPREQPQLLGSRLT
jgi:membrane associated rhomboid family serine protease